MFNKAISLLLCILMLINIFASCERSSSIDTIDNETSTEATTTASTTDTETLPDTETETELESESESVPITITDPPHFPGHYPDYPSHDIPDDRDYGGYEFIILADSTVSDNEFIEEADGDLITDTIITRQEYTEEFLNVNLNIVVIDGGYRNAEKYAAEISAASGAGCPYDLALAHNLIPPVLAAKGLCRDLAESTDLHLYQTDKPYWGKNILQEIAIGGRIFWTSDNASLNNIRNMLCIFTNIEYFERINERFVEYDLYSMVYNGLWTMENMLVLAQNAYKNVSDEVEGVPVADDLDAYGIQASSSKDWLDTWFYAAGFKYTKLNANGVYEWTLNGTAETEFISWWQSKLNDNDIYKQDGTTHKMFKENRAMFALSNLGMTEEVEVNFTVLPLPLYNAKVKDSYSTPLSDGYSSWLIPRAARTEAFHRASTVIEVMASESNRRVAPAYLEAYKRRTNSSYSNGDDMRKMFNTIRSSVVFDLGYLYGDTLSVEYIGIPNDESTVYFAIRNIWSGNGTGDYSDIETVWPKIKNTATTKLNDLMTELTEY